MTDNPHYVTPDEAKKKSCPMAKPNTAFHDPRCNGPNCMAWRWQMFYKTPPHTNGLLPRPLAAYEYSTTHGYCGMVQT